MTATQRLHQTPMPYFKAQKQLDLTIRPTREVSLLEIKHLVDECRKGVNESKTLPSMPAVRP